MSQNNQPPSLARGFMLGIPFFGVLIAATLVAYLVAGVVGWTGRGQIVAALCAGPVIGIILLLLIARAIRSHLT